PVGAAAALTGGWMRCWLGQVPVGAPLFFFSSRRRHTRFSRDWSSDVCSSDLGERRNVLQSVSSSFAQSLSARSTLQAGTEAVREIGRASCRERVHQGVGVPAIRDGYPISTGAPGLVADNTARGTAATQ